MEKIEITLEVPLPLLVNDHAVVEQVLGEMAYEQAIKVSDAKQAVS